MKFFIRVLIFNLFFGNLYIHAQTCTTLGQNPSTAFPVCGTNSFSQTTVPYCGGKDIPGPCSRDGLRDINPFWYKFTCFKAGTLGFLITPNDLKDDYDWQIFDVTDRSPNDVYTDATLFVACNWSGNTGRTGASSAGSSLQNCAGETYPTFSKMPQLKLRHNYIMLISHFTVYTPSQNGYKLSFNGGTASITDPLLPALKNATSSCDGSQVRLVLNKKMKCSSLVLNGSDFTISSAASVIVSSAAASCSTGFDMDSLVLTLNKPLLPGSYTLTIQEGTDANTLLDNCDRDIAAGSTVAFEVFPKTPTPYDSLVPVKCAPQSLQLIFKKNIQCNSIAPDGSDFIITGPSTVTVSSANGNCSNGLTNTINVNLSGPIVKGGTYQIKLVRGNDGNTIVDECSQETPAGSLSFTTKDTVSAFFNYEVFQGCAADTIKFSHDAGNGVNEWLWKLDYSGNSTSQNPTAIFKNFSPKQITLSVSNGFCSDTTTRSVSLGNELEAAFEVPDILCPEDAAVFINKSIGNIVTYKWDFSDANSSSLQTPAPKHFPILSAEKLYQVRLVVKSNVGCLDTAVNNIKVLKSCYIDVPNAFTPNSDGLNDYLYPLNAYKAGNLEFKVYNRVGQLVFQTNDWTVKWDGKIKGEPQDSGIYVWILAYTNRDTGMKVIKKGSTVLIR